LDCTNLDKTEKINRFRPDTEVMGMADVNEVAKFVSTRTFEAIELSLSWLTTSCDIVT
jgi:hypothetical protein